MFIPTKFFRAASAAIALSAGLTACQTFGTVPGAESIGYREARFAEIAAIQAWRACRDDALALDRQAQENGDASKYLAKCEADLGPDGAQAARDERLRAFAVAVQNRLKGGDVVSARSDLEKLKRGFPDQDLYLADGGSFIASMEVLLGIRGQDGIEPFALANIPGPMKVELRRVRYWQRH